MSYNDIARKYIGIKQGTTGHKAIVDYYNSHIKPLPRQYRVKYSDAWCATFASVIMNMGGAVNAPYECSVTRMYQKAKSHGQLVSNPKPGDFVIYDWGNNGTLDHVGVVDKVTPKTLTVIEGNKSHAVGVRTISRASSEIEAYIRVPGASTQPITNNLDRVVNDVIQGKYGNGTQRKTNLERAGYNYSQIQKLVNQKLRG